jgi:single-strand DNA-binding protein
MNETSVTMVGNVISELRQRRTPEGHKVVSFRMAANERRFDPETGQWVNGRHVFATVNCWRRLADGVASSLGKGDPVVVTGRMYTRDYEYEGQQRLSLDVDAVAVGPDLTRCTADLQRHRPQSDGARDAPAASLPDAAGVVGEQHRDPTSPATAPARGGLAAEGLAAEGSAAAERTGGEPAVEGPDVAEAAVREVAVTGAARGRRAAVA